MRQKIVQALPPLQHAPPPSVVRPALSFALISFCSYLCFLRLFDSSLLCLSVAYWSICPSPGAKSSSLDRSLMPTVEDSRTEGITESLPPFIMQPFSSYKAAASPFRRISPVLLPPKSGKHSLGGSSISGTCITLRGSTTELASLSVPVNELLVPVLGAFLLFLCSFYFLFFFSLSDGYRPVLHRRLYSSLRTCDWLTWSRNWSSIVLFLTIVSCSFTSASSLYRLTSSCWLLNIFSLCVL